MSPDPVLKGSAAPSPPPSPTEALEKDVPLVYTGLQYHVYASFLYDVDTTLHATGVSRDAWSAGSIRIGYSSPRV